MHKPADVRKYKDFVRKPVLALKTVRYIGNLP